MFRSCISLLLILIISPVLYHAQVDQVYTGDPTPKEVRKDHKKVFNDEFVDKLLWGGNFQAWLGNPTFIYLTPTIGYAVTEELQIGTGVVYNYTSYRYSANSRFSQSIFGGHSYLRYQVGETVFLQGQFDKLYQPDWYSVDPQAHRWVSYLMGGLGFRQMAGEKSWLITSIMYNVLPDPLSIYPNRLIIQFGFVSSF